MIKLEMECDIRIRFLCCLRIVANSGTKVEKFINFLEF